MRTEVCSKCGNIIIVREEEDDPIMGLLEILDSIENGDDPGYPITHTGTPVEILWN